ncbi:hypothetical protein WJX84_005962 [Apatococcus fuscideae]|uniref:DNA annealing helicase and endonuclease ZRANB3 n=1 Tax=Apatococcus fuscideae TaxID=2026836 RepID=A0AAW1TDA2_9CHLO
MAFDWGQVGDEEDLTTVDWDLVASKRPRRDPSGPLETASLLSEQPDTAGCGVPTDAQVPYGPAADTAGSGDRYPAGMLAATAPGGGPLEFPHQATQEKGSTIQQKAARFAEACKQQHLAQPEPPYERGVSAGQRGGIWWELAAPRLPHPWLSLEISGPATFQAAAAPGAQAAVSACGGVLALLQAAGLDARLWAQPAALPAAPAEDPKLAASAVGAVSADTEGAESNSPAGLLTATADSVQLSLEHYEAVRQALPNKRHHGLELVDTSRPAAFIPAPTLAAFRRVLVPLLYGVIQREFKGPRRRKSAEKFVEVSQQQKSLGAIPGPLASALLPFQSEGVRWGVEHGGRVLIADEMGVGKTVQAIALASAYQEEWPLLIIAPASLRLVWAEELERWHPHLRPSQVHVIENRTDRLDISKQLPQVVITSYEMLQRLTCDACRTGIPQNAACPGRLGCMAAVGWRVVIADESHTLRTSNRAPDARHTEAVVSVVKRAAHAIFLSGTPSLSRPFDLFRQVDALRPGLLGPNREVFAQRYCARRLVPVWQGGHRTDQRKWDNSGLARATELHLLLKQEVMVRRLKVEVMAQLPPKRRQVVRLPPPKPSDWPPSELPVPNEEEEEGANGQQVPGYEGAQSDEQQKPRELSGDHRTGLAKLPTVIEWLINKLGHGHDSAPARDSQSMSQVGRPGRQSATVRQPTSSAAKLLVFAHHRGVMNKLAAALEGQGGGADWQGIRYVRIDGASDSRDRRAAVAQFRDDPGVQVALLSVTAAGIGLDFSSASAVVFVELPQEIAFVRQAEDRAHRHGQRMPVNVYFLVSRGTSDDRRWRALNRSLERVTAVHDAAQGADAGGILIDRVCEARDGMGYTQAHPPPPSAALQRASTVRADLAAEDALALLDMQDKVWFEVSANTGRVHMHMAADGSRMLGLSLPLELLLMGEGPSVTLQDIYRALDTRKAGGAAHVGPAGVLAVIPGTTSKQLKAIVAAARAFAAEWIELRSIFQSKLFGHVLRPPLQSAVEELESKASEAGAYGSSLERFTDAWQGTICAPPGSSVHTITVLYPRIGKSSLYKQAFKQVTERLCITCGSAVSCNLPVEAILDGAMHLFCGVECETNFCIRANSGAMRRALFRLERGICQTCKLDCHALVGRIRTIEKGTDGWEPRRRRLLLDLAPTFGQHGAKAYTDRLVKYALEGNAWHADHVMPVHRGGGLCGLENLRTLCVLCHMEVTKRQARQRAVARKAAQQTSAHGNTHPGTQKSITLYMSQASPAVKSRAFKRGQAQPRGASDSPTGVQNISDPPGSPPPARARRKGPKP